MTEILYSSTRNFQPTRLHTTVKHSTGHTTVPNLLLYCMSKVPFRMWETVLGTELSLSSRGRMTLGVREIFWFISHTLPQCHALKGVADTYL
jgi:hypothetical protein